MEDGDILTPMEQPPQCPLYYLPAKDEMRFSHWRTWMLMQPSVRSGYCAAYEPLEGRGETSFPVLMEVPARPTCSNPASLKRPMQRAPWCSSSVGLSGFHLNIIQLSREMLI
ncbi:hypothetical protein R3I94_003168 [Phoxinus phoxinus]